MPVVEAVVFHVFACFFSPLLMGGEFPAFDPLALVVVLAGVIMVGGTEMCVDNVDERKLFLPPREFLPKFFV